MPDPTHASPSEPLAHATIQRLRRLQEITALLNSSLKPAEIRTQAVEAATIVMEAEAGSLLLLDEVRRSNEGDLVRRRAARLR